MFCDRCGLNLYAGQTVCSRCNITLAREWLQLIGLAALAIAFACNLVATLQLQSAETQSQPSVLIRGWLSLTVLFAHYGWLLLALTLLTWAFWPRFGYTPEIEVKVARVLLILLLAGSIGRVALYWIRADSIATVQNLLIAYPALPSLLAWLLVLISVGMLCRNPETREHLLGDGRLFCAISLGLLTVIVALTLAAWATS